MSGQNAAIGGRALPFGCFEDDRTGAIAEENAGRAVVPVEDAGESLRPDHQHALGQTTTYIGVSSRDGINEAGADRLDIEGKAVAHAETVLDVHRGCGEGIVRRGCRADDEIDIGRRKPAILKRRTRRLLAERRRRFVIARNVTLTDASALDNPFIGSVHDVFHVAIGHYALWKCGSESANH
jgi:hypothetical protein